MVFKKNIVFVVFASGLLTLQTVGAQEPKKPIVIKFEKTDSRSIASKSALACGYMTSVAIIARFIQQPVGLWDFFRKALGVSITVGFTGTFIGSLYYPVFAWLAHYGPDDSSQYVTNDSLAALITQWNNVKNDLPETLRNKFDLFIQKYEKNGQLEVTEEQAMVFVQGLVQEINHVYDVYNTAINQEAITAALVPA